MTRLYHSALVASARNLALVPHRSRVRLEARRVYRALGAAIDRNLRRTLSVALMISLLATSTPAAAQTVVTVGKEWHASFGFWLRANHVSEKLYRALSGQRLEQRGPQEKQQDRDARVSRIQIFPGDVTVHEGERVSFTATAYDRDEAPVGGVSFSWTARDEDRNVATRVSQRGDFEATVTGNFNLTVAGAGHGDSVKVSVLEGEARRKAKEKPIRVKDVSNRESPSGTATKSNRKAPDERHGERASKTTTSSQVKTARLRRAHVDRASSPERTVSGSSAAALPLAPFGGWDDDNWQSSSDPCNRRGDPPGVPMDGGAGTGNFQLAAPVYASASRGINISLGLAYNSRLWTKAGTQITFDIDREWPAPGWSLGFGKMLSMGTNGAMIVDADGTRHSYGGTVSIYSWGSTFTLHTTDGTFIDYTGQTNSSGSVTWAQAKLANGAIIQYSAPGPGAGYPTVITDPNGNYLTITYVNNTGPQIQSVTDTLGRVIVFYYDPNNLLTAITAPGLNGGAARTLVRLHYKQISLSSTSYSFPGLSAVVRDPNPWVIDAIYYPATSTGYWFGDSAGTGYSFGTSDSYSTYGMLAKVVEVRGMTFSGPDPVPPAQGPTGQGTITFAGQMTKKEVYNYPLFVGDSSGTQSSSLTDAPTYTSMTDTWTRDGANTDSATTTFALGACASPRTVTITLPNGTRSTQYSYNSPGNFLDGLVYLDETRDSAGTLLQSSSSTWAQGSYESPRPTRVEATNYELNKKTASVFEYGTVYNQVTAVYNYDFADPSVTPTTLLRVTRMQYQNSASYTNRHIFNLPLTVEVYGPDNFTRVSRTDYQYDGQTLTDTPSVVMHNDASNPYAPPVWVEGYWDWNCDAIDQPCFQYWVPGYWQPVYDPSTDYRGNVTQVTTYADAIGLNGAVSETRRYDITGNMLKASTSCCEETTFSYTLDTQYGYPLSQTRGSATDPYTQVATSATYDFNTGLILSATNANGRTSQTNYESATLRPSSASLPSGAYTDYGYDDTAMTVIETTHLAPSEGGAIADQNVKYLNGRGQVRREQALGPNSVWDFVDTVYDNMGNASQQSRPYRSGDTLQWSTVAYDSLGRTTTVTAPDGSTTQTFYNEGTRPSVASSSPGETTRVQDAWGRERWGRTDAQGRLVEVVEPNPSGSGSVASGGLVTTYAYNTLGNLTTVTQGAQTRLFQYDSLGRLTAQKLAETSATLNNVGAYQAGGGTWSDVFTYDDRSNLTSRTDARGVKTVYNYASDPLNRLQSVSWDTTGFGDTVNPILPAATVSYQYRTKSSGSQLLDIAQLSSVTTSGSSTEGYSYDSEGRISSKTLTLTSRPSYPFVTDYIFDTLDRITDVRYPAEYGNGTQPRKVVHHDFDIASRLTGLTVNGANHASQIVYNAASQTTQLKVGASGANQITENYGYDSQTGLLASQTVVRGTSPSATTLLDLAYDYAGANGKRTGQLTKILNNLNSNKNRSYSYDALGRLITAQGGPASAPLWTQTYSYDNYGNRTSVSASGYSARNGNASPGSAGASPAMSAQSEPGADRGPQTGSPLGVVDATGSSASTAQSTVQTAPTGSSDPQVTLHTEQLAAKTEIDLPDSLRTNTPRSTSNFHHPSRSARSAPTTPQGSPPVFTDDPLVPGVTVIKAVHITELRTAVNQARSRAGLAAANWAEAVTAGVTVIKAAHVVELRARLDEARAVLGLPAASYTDPTLTAGLTTVKAVHIQELRQRVTEALTGYSSPIPTDGIASLAFNSATNRITTAGFDYDKTGNQVRALAPGGGSQRFQYDAANRLVKVKADDNVTVLATYTYGDSNERLIADEGGLRTNYVSEGGTAIAEYAESGSSTTPQWSKTYIYLSARLLSTLTPNGSGGEAIQHHHPDRLGTRLVTDPSSGTSFEQVTLPFGTALNAESTISTKRRFTSYDRSSATGLDYAINRHYDSQQGRFTQVDPIGMGAASPGDPQSLNMYAYCGNDPVNYIDPDGLFWGKLFKWIGKIVKWAAIALAIVVAVALVTIALGPEGSLLLKFGLFLWNTVAPPLAAALSAATGFKLAGPVLGPGGTPVWNPHAGTGLFSSNWRRYVLYQNGGDIDVIRTVTNACKNGKSFPNCSVGQPGFWESLIPIWGPGRAAVDDYQTGHWGWGIFHTVEAISDVLIVKSLIKGAVKGVAKGGEKIIVRHYTDEIGTAAITRSGALRSGTYVTLSSEIPAGATQLKIESLLEIQTGRGTNYFDVATRTSNLRIPSNGARTSGGALQYQLKRRTRIR